MIKKKLLFSETKQGHELQSGELLFHAAEAHWEALPESNPIMKAYRTYQYNLLAVAAPTSLNIFTKKLHTLLYMEYGLRKSVKAV